MDKIRVTPEQLEGVANSIKKTKKEITNIFNRLNVELINVREQWLGNQSNNILEKLGDYNREFSSFSLKLDEQENNLRSAAKMFSRIDNEALSNGPKELNELDSSHRDLWLISWLAYVDQLSADGNHFKAKDDNEYQEYFKVIQDLLKRENSPWKVIATTSGGGTDYQAVALMNRESGEVVIGHRGTQEPLDQVANLFNVGLGFQNNQIKAAGDFTEKVQAIVGDDVKIVHTGHSLGGHLAQKMAINKDSVALTYNSPGFSPLGVSYRDIGVMNSPEISNRIKEFTIDDDFIGDTISDVIGKKPKDVEQLLAGDGNKSRYERHSIKSFDGYFDENGNIDSKFYLKNETENMQDILRREKKKKNNAP